MIFNFLKYIKPTWYFNLKPTIDYSYFPKMETINKKGFQLEIDDEFTSEEAKNRDLAWRAFQCGFIAPSEKDGLDVWEKSKLPIVDEYRFFRKNFHKAWVFYTFLLRLITFHNPFVEIRAFWKARNVKRENYFQKHFKYQDYEPQKSREKW